MIGVYPVPLKFSGFIPFLSGDRCTEQTVLQWFFVVVVVVFKEFIGCNHNHHDVDCVKLPEWRLRAAPHLLKYSDRRAWENSVGLDQTPQNAASNQGPHCLPFIYISKKSPILHYSVVNINSPSCFWVHSGIFWKFKWGLLMMPNWPKLNILIQETWTLQEFYGMMLSMIISFRIYKAHQQTVKWTYSNLRPRLIEPI